MLSTLAQRVDHPVEFKTLQCPRCNEQLLECRHDAASRCTDKARVGRDASPPEHDETLVDGDRLDRALHARSGIAIGRQEGDADRVVPGGRQVEVHGRSQERVGNLQEDPGTITAVRLAARSSAVLEVAQGGQCIGDDAVRRDSGERRKEGDAAGIMLTGGVIEALSGRHIRIRVLHHSSNRRRRTRRSRPGESKTRVPGLQ